MQLLGESHGGRAAKDQHLCPVLGDGGPARLDEARVGLLLVRVVIGDAEIDGTQRRQTRVQAVPPDGVLHLRDPLAAADEDREAVPERGREQHRRFAGGRHHQAAREFPGFLQPQVVEAPDDGSVVSLALELGHAVEDVGHDEGLVVVVLEVVRPHAEPDLPQLIPGPHNAWADVAAVCRVHPDGCDVRDAAHDVLPVVSACPGRRVRRLPRHRPIMHDDQ